MEKWDRREVTKERLMKVLRCEFDSREARAILNHPQHGLCNEASEQKHDSYHFKLMWIPHFLKAEVLEARRNIYGEHLNNNNNNVDQVSDHSDEE